ncbi:MAG: DUF4328 domain-containing protein [Bacteroidetes bacterium]|nr:DUF4328 domain-containing protein [Bacteroidota bacterium]
MEELDSSELEFEVGILDNSVRARHAINALLANGVSLIYLIFVNLYSIRLMKIGGVSIDFSGGLSYYHSDRIKLLLLFGYVALLISTVLCAIFFLRWFRRSYANLERLKISVNENNAMAIWWFVIPIANLFKPFMLAKEIWRKMTKSLEQTFEDQRFEESADFILIWWLAFISASITGNRFLEEYLQQNFGSASLTFSTQLDIFQEGMYLIAALLAVRFIRKMAEREKMISDTLPQLRASYAVREKPGLKRERKN